MTYAEVRTNSVRCCEAAVVRLLFRAACKGSDRDQRCVPGKWFADARAPCVEILMISLAGARILSVNVQQYVSL
jgi:hypothetical protein